ncbi:MAG: hypothetical protein AAGH73_11475 [Pseudomonadota bacterium]
MKDTGFLRRICALCLVTGLAACAAPGDISRANPDFFLVRADRENGQLSGAFNPAGFTPGEVARLVGEICAGGGLASFGTGAGGELVSFAATCAGGVADGARVAEIERAGPGTVVIEILGSDGRGNIRTRRTVVAL